MNEAEIGPSCLLFAEHLQVFELGEDFPECLREEYLFLVPQFNLNLVIMQAKRGVNVAILLVQNAGHLGDLLQQIDIKQIDGEEGGWTTLVILPRGGPSLSHPLGQLVIRIVPNDHRAIIQYRKHIQVHRAQARKVLLLANIPTDLIQYLREVDLCNSSKNML